MGPSGARGDDLADPSAQRAEPPVVDRPTHREVIRRYERSSPGELVHLDIKKIGQIPPGGGWRIHGRGSPQAKRKRRPGASREVVGFELSLGVSSRL